VHVELGQVGLLNAGEVEQAGVLWRDVLGNGPCPLLVHIFNRRLKCYFAVRITQTIHVKTLQTLCSEDVDKEELVYLIVYQCKF